VVSSSGQPLYAVVRAIHNQGYEIKQNNQFMSEASAIVRIFTNVLLIDPKNLTIGDLLQVTVWS